MGVIQGRAPKAFFKFFEEISAIPRMSYHEERVADYLENFARERGLFCYRDAYHNVLICKDGTAGYADHAPVMLQGHTDMVCEKNGDTVHDFMSDPLELYIDGDYLRARGTTLGADDGVAVATMLAVLDGAMEQHPPVECLFTASEEVGLDGATNFDYSKIAARKMINIDSERLGEITAGCAGGIRSEIALTTSPVPFCGRAMRLVVKGLAGGHSGENIHEGRANANKLMGRLLTEAVSTCGACLISIEGGSKDNAIPRECTAVIAVEDTDTAQARLQALATRIAEELIVLDRSFCFSCEETQTVEQMLDCSDTNRVVAMLCGVANGVFEMDRNVKGLVNYSRNLGVVHTEENTVRFIFCSRSPLESRIDASVAELDALARALGGKTKHYARYPGWDFAVQSPLREAYAKAYKAVTGEDVTVKIIHAGLECGFIYANLPDIDIISIAPNLYNLHSPDEALDIPSVEIFWRSLAELMRNM